jgi:hypothetical protein
VSMFSYQRGSNGAAAWGKASVVNPRSLVHDRILRPGPLFGISSQTIGAVDRGCR